MSNLSGQWDTTNDFLADLQRAKEAAVDQAAQAIQPARMWPQPVSRARWKWLFEKGLIDDQGNMTAQGYEYTGRNLALKFQLIPSQPLFDSQGIPTDETLQMITNWEPTDCAGLLAFIEAAWNQEFGVVRKIESDDGNKMIRFVTGGWNANESLIGAFQENRIAWAICWVSSNRGGAHEFDLER